MQNEMDQEFDTAFDSSFESNLDTVSQVDSDQPSPAESDRWETFDQQMDQLDSDFSDMRTSQRSDDTSDSWDGWSTDGTSDTTVDRTTDRTQDRSSDDSTRDGSSGSDDSQTSVSPSGSTAEKAEEYLHRYINQERQERGLAPLNFDSDLRQTAREKSQDMARRGYFSHTDPDGDNFRDIYTANGISRSECRLGAENIARTWFNRNVQTDTGSTVHYESAEELADGLRRQWMTSDAHRDAILRERYNDHGLGIEITSSGRVYATEHFCT